MRTDLSQNPRAAAAARRWYLVDADRQVLGRLASRVAALLKGKHKPTFAPHVDGGDFVVVVNAARIRLTGRKLEDKVYYRHSGYPGGLKVRTAGDLLATRPERLVELAVRGMLPKNKLGRRMLARLKVYPGPDHPHAAQRPEPLVLAERRTA
ncbi:MAG TPA: 50S ribosomal protein L13 [Thermodesulfobacteriota bacterium]|nr:50S ribosomal protein L13 [Thermodesulfobacteriota bacterium]